MKIIKASTPKFPAGMRCGCYKCGLVLELEDTKADREMADTLIDMDVGRETIGDPILCEVCKIPLTITRGSTRPKYL